MTASDSALIVNLVERLSEPTAAEPAATFPRGPSAADHAGLYAWWSDEDGLAALSAPFGVTLRPLIYAGQAGATSNRSKTERAATLRSRISGNHLNGNIGSSTFRRTLTAVLCEPLGLRVVGPDRLDTQSNRTVSAWIREHLRVVIAPVDDRATLASVEHAVLQILDPPLNLMGMGPTPIRTLLRQLRATLNVAPPRGTTTPTPARSMPALRTTSDSPATLKLHEAMVEVLRDSGWLSFGELADRIAARGLYRTGDGGSAGPGQLRLRATKSGGRYVHLFEVDGGRLRLRRNED